MTNGLLFDKKKHRNVVVYRIEKQVLIYKSLQYALEVRSTAFLKFFETETPILIFSPALSVLE
jgi:hypothetical protein